jgi:hypothetical protein
VGPKYRVLISCQCQLPKLLEVWNSISASSLSMASLVMMIRSNAKDFGYIHTWLHSNGPFALNNIFSIGPNNGNGILFNLRIFFYITYFSKISFISLIFQKGCWLFSKIDIHEKCNQYRLESEASWKKI